MIARLSGSPVKVGATAPPLKVNRTTFEKVTLSDLQAGDIGFQVQRHKRDFKQFWITVGGHWASLVRPMRTDPYVVHAFVVVKPHPDRMELHTIDGAADNYTGINHLRMNFGPNKFRIVPGGKYVFFRPNDPDMQKRIVRTGTNWAWPNMNNFSIVRAVESPFHSVRFDKRARANARLLANQADVAAPPKKADGTLFKMSCSEFVFSVLRAASTSRWRHDNPQAQDTLGDNAAGPFGKELAYDAKGMHPPALQAILGKSPHWSPVGYLTENG